MTQRRGLRAVVLAVGVLVVAAGVAIAVSALTDWPSKSAYSEIVVTAPRERVWDVITDLGAYPEWNPVVTQATGKLAEGESLEVELSESGGDSNAAELEVVIFRPMRKLRWQERLLVPGLRDREYEIIVAPAGEGRWRVVQRERIEGVAAPFTSIDSIDEGLDRIARALKKRAEAVSS